MKVNGKYFYGNEISEYGQKNGYVDYRTLAKAFNAVMANDIMAKTDAANLGYWEPVGCGEIYYEDDSGNIYTYDEAEEKREEIREILESIEDEESEEYIALSETLEALEEEKYSDVFQWFIVDGNGAEILEEAGKIVYYNSALDMYIWGVTHYGTSWDYVLTNIRCNVSDGTKA